MKYVVMFILLAGLATAFGLLYYFNRRIPQPEGCQAPECRNCSNVMCAHHLSTPSEKETSCSK